MSFAHDCLGLTAFFDLIGYEEARTRFPYVRIARYAAGCNTLQHTSSLRSTHNRIPITREFDHQFYLQPRICLWTDGNHRTPMRDPDILHIRPHHSFSNTNIIQDDQRRATSFSKATSHITRRCNNTRAYGLPITTRLSHAKVDIT